MAKINFMNGPKKNSKKLKKENLWNKKFKNQILIVLLIKIKKAMYLV